MKKILVLVALAFGVNVNAQLQAELNIGFPTGDYTELYEFEAEFKFNYVLPIGDEVKLGPSIGGSMYVGKKYENMITTAIGIEDRYDPLFVFPVALSGQYTLSETVVFGLQFGYGFIVSDIDETSGGFYYRPSIGYLLAENIAVQLLYSNVNSNDANLSHFGLGFMISR